MARMGANEVQSSLYLSFPVKPCRALRTFLATFPGNIGRPMPFHSLHVSLLYGYEFAYPVRSAESQAKLEKTKEQLTQRLGKLGLIGNPLESNPAVLKPYGKFVGLGFEPTDALAEARRVTSETIADGLGIIVPEGLPDIHVSVVRRRKGAMAISALHLSQALVILNGPPEVEIVATTVGAANYTHAWQSAEGALQVAV